MVRLYYTEPWLRRFDARVVNAVEERNRRLVWLDRTAFYPTSGGQPFDTGSLSGVPVLDVFDDDEGRVAHVIDGSLDVGQAVVGEIAWPRRFDHMQQHTGQHLLSAAFEHLHHARTESFHLGTGFSTIDLACEVSPAGIASAEDDANRVVWEGRPVSIRFVTGDEAARLPLRKDPVKSGRIRLIEIEGYDLSACGGTHVSRTGEVGLIAVRGWERFRGGTRVEFVCGMRALAGYRAWREAATGAARLLSVVPGDLPAAVGRLQEEIKETRHVARDLAGKVASLEAATLVSRARQVGGVAVLVEAVDGADVNALKLLAGSFVKEPSRVVVLFTGGSPAQVIAMRSAGVTPVSCAALVSALAQRFGGRGGGKPEGAQGGGLNATSADLVTAAEAMIESALDGR